MNYQDVFFFTFYFLQILTTVVPFEVRSRRDVLLCLINISDYLKEKSDKIGVIKPDEHV